MTNAIRYAIKYLRFYGGRYACVVCGTPVRKFFRFSLELEKQAKMHGFPYDFRRVETLNFDNCNCPFCLSSDRERLYILYLNQVFSRRAIRYKILDFAPNRYFSAYLKKQADVEYVTCDLFRHDVDVKIDACDMHVFENEIFDIVIFSHVLEHVESPHKALSEIYRILKSDGFAIIMTPLFLDVHHTVENPAHKTPAERWKNYGQDDHVRLYSKKDFISQLTQVGFRVMEITPTALDDVSVRRNAIDENSILYLVVKSGAHG